jgi:hypothetical protein
VGFRHWRAHSSPRVKNKGARGISWNLRSGQPRTSQVAQVLLDNLIERGLKIDPSLVLFAIDGSKALRKAAKQTFGEDVRIQRCQRLNA